MYIVLISLVEPLRLYYNVLNDYVFLQNQSKRHLALASIARVKRIVVKRGDSGPLRGEGVKPRDMRLRCVSAKCAIYKMHFCHALTKSALLHTA